MNVTECYCKIGSEFYPEDRMNINYSTNKYNEAFKEIVIFNKDYNGLPHNIKLYINHRTFKSSYRIYVLDTRYQNDHIGRQPIQLNFIFSVAVADFIGHALVLTRKVISVNSDGLVVIVMVNIIVNDIFNVLVNVIWETVPDRQYFSHYSSQYLSHYLHQTISY